MKPIENEIKIFPGVGDIYKECEVIELIPCSSYSRCRRVYTNPEVCGGCERLIERLLGKEKHCCYQIKISERGKPSLFPDENCKEGSNAKNRKRR